MLSSLRRLPLGSRLHVSLLVVWLVLVLGFIAVAFFYIRPTYVGFEVRQADNEIAQLESAFVEDRESLTAAARQVAASALITTIWRTATAPHANERFDETSLSTWRIDWVQVVDAKNQVLFSQSKSPHGRAIRHFAESDAREYLEQSTPRASFTRASGGNAFERQATFRLSDGILMELATLRLRGMAGRETCSLTLLAGRVITQKFLKSITTRTRLEFDLSAPPPAAALAFQPLVTFEKGKVVARKWWRDGLGRPLAQLRVVRAATIVQQGDRAVGVATTSLVSILTLSLLILGKTLHSTLIVPLRRLAESIQRMKETGSLGTRLGLARTDEIGLLAQSFDHLITQLGERARALEHLATTDELTGIMNRRAIMEFLQQEIDRAVRYDHGLAIVLFDIDWFKRINDTEGHAVGDRALRQIAELLETTLRETDRVGRYGGEEFLAVMPHQTRNGALVAAERLRAAVEKYRDFGVPWTVTLSGGIAFWEGYSREGLLYVADKNLYHAKVSGRNCVASGDVSLTDLPKSSVAAIRIQPRRLTGNDGLK